jgi:DNA polymerase-3 subunit beta
VTVEKEGKLCIPARKLFEIIRKSKGRVFESVDEQWLKVRAGASDFRLACLPPAISRLGQPGDPVLMR